jgi:SPP1 family phage portal protein
MDITVIRSLLAINQNITSDIIKDLISDHTARHAVMKSLYERYKATITGVPVFTRTFDDENKVNNKLNNDFFGDIIDTKIGYFAGKPISYSIDRNMYMQDGKNLDETLYLKHTHVISGFNIRCNIEDLDSETAKKAAICGYGSRLLYIDKNAMERVIDIDPWETIFVNDGSISEAQYALRYYTISVIKDNKTVERTRVEWYDAQNITFYIMNDKGEYVLDDMESVNPKPHLFDDVPLLCFPNNEELQGDVEKVLHLIDGYDNTLSDINSELEQFRLAYMVFVGMELDAETIDAAKRTGAFGLEEGCSAAFLTKTLNDVIIENHLNRLEENILRFAKSVNFGDESFGGTITGIAMKFKLFGLESKCITAERKFTASLRNQYRILTTAWQKKGIAIDYTNIFFTFKRNFPLNLLDEADTTTKLKGQISERTRLSLLSFVDDVEYEMQLIEQENSEKVNLDAGLEDETNGNA